MVKRISVGGVAFGGRASLALIAGPCVIESRKACLDLAGRLVRLAKSESIPFVFKASYDKANRTSVDSFRGPGVEKGLEILAEVRDKYGVPVLTDVHTAEEAIKAARVVDIIQIPAFLCRQTDLLLAAGETGAVVNIKKGQFLSPGDMVNVVAKVESTGNRRIMVTERGASFGYNNLVADMRSLPEMSEIGYPVIFDATHSVQRPGGAGKTSSGDARWAPVLARAAVAAGCDGVFIETYVEPEKALSDGANAIRFSEMRKLWKTLRSIDEVVA
jgi:2-dehydro-3-deoxyphosphooctonate aldolase (KDO 8-P synthase)